MYTGIAGGVVLAADTGNVAWWFVAILQNSLSIKSVAKADTTRHSTQQPYS